MQAVLDSAALMLSKDLSSGTVTTSQISTKAKACFNALFTDTSALPSVSVAATYAASTSMSSTIQVTAMKPTGNTNQGIGLAWGWMTLSTGDPMNAPDKDTNYTYKDAIVLLSDGLNTQNRWYSNASQIDAQQKKLCDNAREANITIYTVQVNTGSDPTSRVLQYCASSTDKFYLVTSIW